MQPVRVRFAPSPTGSLHIGGARTALFNWLFARSQQGTMVLRLEDTDAARSRDDSAQGILDGLRWLDLDWDEGPDVGGPMGPYCQSERLAVYQKYTQELLDKGLAYYCFCSPDQISRERNQALQEKRNYRHNCPYREASKEQVENLLNKELKPVVRLKAPHSGYTVVKDLIRGEVAFENDLGDDFIIQKSDGWPTYNFAVVVDDHTMKISHVIRAEEHLSNTPKQILIYEALDFPLPLFAHVSMILAPDRSKLSKRHGATSVQEFRDLGYLPEALVNYLALLGWSSGEDATLLSREELLKRFSLDQVSRSSAVYDLDKLTWMNGWYISQAEPADLLDILAAQPAPEWWKDVSRDDALQVLNLLQPRLKNLQEFFTSASYFFTEVEAYDPKGVQKYWTKESSAYHLQQVYELVEQAPFAIEPLEKAFRHKAGELGLKAAELIHPTRLALSGRTSTPGLFEVMVVLGRDTCLKRLRKALRYLETKSS